MTPHWPGGQILLALWLALQCATVEAEILLPPDPSLSLGNVVDLGGFVDENDRLFSSIREAEAEAATRPVWLVSPMYTACPHTCSPITQNLKKALGELRLDASGYRVVSFSFDREESAEGLRSFRARMGLPADWVILRAPDPDGLDRVLKALDFRTISLGEGQFDHPNLIAVLTPDLRLYGYLFGVTVAPGELERMLRAARDGVPGAAPFRAVVLAIAALGFVISAFVFAQVLSRHRRRQGRAASQPSLTGREVRRKRVKKAGKRLIRAVSDFIVRQSRIGVGPTFPPTVFPWLEQFEANWRVIRAELEQVLANRDALPAFHQVSPDQKRISQGDSWKIFPFYGFGESFEPNLARCPETARLLKQVPHLRNAMFSILAPHYHIPPHKGPTNGIIRIHLGLIVPGGQDVCRIRVGDRIFGWEEGKCVVFDDYFEHEVWNDTDQPRVVLFFDVDRPMKPLGWLVNRFVIAAIKRSAYVKDAKENAREWNTRYTDFESRRSTDSKPPMDADERR